MSALISTDLDANQWQSMGGFAELFLGLEQLRRNQHRIQEVA